VSTQEQGIKPHSTSLTDRAFSIDAVTFPPAGALLFKGLWCYLPERLLPYIAYLPAKQLRVFRKYMGVARKVASRLLDEAFRESQGGKRDIMSLMGKCCSDDDLFFHMASQSVSPREFRSEPQAGNEQR